MKRVTRRQFLGQSVAAAAGFVTLGNNPLHLAGQWTAGSEKAQLFKEIQDNADLTLSQSRAPGMSAAAVVNKKLFFSDGFGVMEVGKKKPYMALTVQPICSTSKAFAAVAVMQLVEKGKMDIDQPMVELVPYFHLTDPRYTDITIRHLLAHISGLPGDMSEEGFLGAWLDPWYDDDAAIRYVKSLDEMNITLTKDPGDPTNFIYSDMNYDILAAVIQEVSGQVFEYYCRDHILKPLGMHQSTFLKPEVPSGLLATAYTRDANGDPMVSPVYPYDRKKAPSSGLFTNAADMLPWAQMHLNGGELCGRRILSPASHALLFEPLVDFGYGYGYGWGWFQYIDELGQKVLYHPGAQPGIISNLILCPNQGQAAFALGNCLGSFEDVWYAANFSWWLYSRISEFVTQNPPKLKPGKMQQKMIPGKVH